MKRFSSHYLFIPGSGFYKHSAFEWADGIITGIFPLLSEMENISWLPGVIALMPAGFPEVTLEYMTVLMEKYPDIHTCIPDGILDREMIPYTISSFDFDTMLPRAGARLRKITG